ncbi:MAG TPA: GGDEF domain-containing protein [Frankiaceae bacterium]|nr:GGDEF domain-containing protein [Frankiaceae bacterium]
MADQRTLAALLGEFARNMGTDFPIQKTLDRLVERVVQVLPVTAAGLTLITPGNAPTYIAASNEVALVHERHQTDLGVGPCSTAVETGEAVSAPNLRSDDRFAAFGPAAVASGLQAVFAFPLRHGSDRLGALDLYRDEPGSLDCADMEAAQTLADVAAAYILNARSRDVALETSDQFRASALRDSLTGLPNRMLLRQRLEYAAERVQRSGTDAAVLVVDLDEFKRVNDRHGHQVGDLLLIAVGDRLAGLVRPGDTLARVAGDEFVFLCEDVRSADNVETLAARIDDAFTHPFAIGDLELAITASVGMAYAGPGEDVSDRLVAEADVAMTQAKGKGGGRHQIIDLREAEKANERSLLESDLREAVAHGDLDVAYQPLVRSEDGVVTGVEALLRWSHRVRGSVPPLTMIHLAEQSGLINEIGSWVLERACFDRQQWLRQCPGKPLDLSVNVSTRQLMTPGFCDTVTRILDRTLMPASSLILEITEAVILDDADRTTTVLSDLRHLGVRLALDDFGTGYSSLSYISKFPVDLVKIDQSFVARIGHDETGPAVIELIIKLAHLMGLGVIAEGVENAQQRDEVTAMHCESLQGFLFARPMSALAITDQLEASPGGAYCLAGVPRPRTRQRQTRSA